ncbi:MAG TPA: hypothetical protein VH298_07380 [Jatrophihabitans sp.]|nr:hypothetical protein [Jatrophihabitans sp.]
MSQLEQVAAGALIRARPWDLTGVGLAAPMVIWGFLGWFGTVGDSAGGLPGFFSGAGAAGIGLVLAAAAVALNQSLAGRPHQPTSPPVAAMLAGAGALVVLGGMIAKPDSATIQAGSVLGLLTALGQAGALVIGWLRGSEKSLKAANVRAAQAQQAAADQAALYGIGQYGAPPYGATPYGAGQYVAGQYGPSYQPYRSYPAPPAPRYPAAQYPPGVPAQSGQYPGWSTSPPAQQYPAAPYGPGQGASWPQATGQYPYPSSQSGTGPEQYPDPYGKNGSPPPSR